MTHHGSSVRRVSNESDGEGVSVSVSTKRQVLISTDGHAGADVWGYKPYLERRYHDAFDRWAAEFRDIWVEMQKAEEGSSELREGVASGDMTLNWDSQMR